MNFCLHLEGTCSLGASNSGQSLRRNSEQHSQPLTSVSLPWSNTYRDIPAFMSFLLYLCWTRVALGSLAPVAWNLALLTRPRYQPPERSAALGRPDLAWEDLRLEDTQRPTNSVSIKFFKTQSVQYLRPSVDSPTHYSSFSPPLFASLPFSSTP